MTSLRQDAVNLINKIPEKKLFYLIQIIKGIDGLFNNDELDSEGIEKSFTYIESMRREMPEIDYDKELKDYRENRYL